MRDLEEFKQKSDCITANRYDDNLKDVGDCLYVQIYGRD